MTKKIAALLLAVTAGVGLSFAVQAPAQASYSNCSTGTVCTWDNPNGSGSPRISFWASPGTCFELTGAADNSADSFYNHGLPTHIQFYDSHGCTGTLLKSEDGRTIFDGVTQANFMQVDTSISHPGCQTPSTCFRNRASSVFFNTGFAGPVLLTQTWSQCPSTLVCLYGATSGGGTPLDYFYRSPGTCYTITIPPALNSTRSVFNDLGNGHHIQLFDSSNCSGSPLHTVSYGANPIPALHHTDMNFTDWDKVSSVFFNNG